MSTDWALPTAQVLYANLDHHDYCPTVRPLNALVVQVMPSGKNAEVSVRPSTAAHIVDLVSAAESEPIASRVTEAFAGFDPKAHAGILFCVRQRHHALVIPSGSGWLCFTWSSQL